MLDDLDNILNYAVVDENNKKLGYVKDCVYNTETHELDQIIVRSNSMIQPFSKELIINKKQIIKIEPNKVTVSSPDVTVSVFTRPSHSYNA